MSNQEVKIPADLRRAIEASPKTEAEWKDLTPIARRDFISWVESAKQPETRKRRVERTPSMLASGKRRPCCYAIVPMTIYRALGTNPKAKAQWRGLTPTERRDFVDWIDSAKDPEAYKQRIDKAFEMLISGKRRP